MTGSTAPRRIVPLREAPALAEQAAQWFSDKWDIPASVYRDSIAQGIACPCAVPQWYVVLDGTGRIVAGLGLIANDFHQRQDLTPNVCAVYVEPDCRRQGIARAMLDYVRRDARRCGIATLYLVTDHTHFYEACGWRFHCLVDCDDGTVSRLYTAPTRSDV